MGHVPVDVTAIERAIVMSNVMSVVYSSTLFHTRK